MSFWVKVFTSFLLICYTYTLSSQIIVSGKVSDNITKLGIPGVTILSENNGTETDFEGKFNIEINEPGKITVNFLGYKEQSVDITASTYLQISLEEKSEVLDATTITASKFEQRLSESTVSVEIIKPSLLKATNTLVLAPQYFSLACWPHCRVLTPYT